MNKTKLLGSAANLDQLKQMVSKFFYTEVSLVPAGDDTWSIHNSTKQIDGCRVVLKGKRYRFEMVSE